MSVMMRVDEKEIERLNVRFEKSSPEEVLRYFMGEYGARIALSSSLGAEDQVLADMMLKIDPKARIFTLDTGRFFPETYSLIERMNITYGIKVEVYFPDYKRVEEMVREHGVNLFYESPEKRHLCCEVRKLEPLGRALSTLDVWVCGLRRSQSVTRRDMGLVEYDKMHDKIKLNPLIAWSEEDVWNYIRKCGVPYNKLHDKNFPSIGCQPCTRAVEPGGDIRSGRWWWEAPEHRECGLHVEGKTE